MRNLLGDYGEYIALGKYNLNKAPSGADGYDAVTIDGLRVQIRANHSSSTIGFRGEADLLLVLKIESSAEWRELYYGSFKPVKEKAAYSKRDNKYMIPVGKLQGLAKRKS
jgi:intein/homing endonuclease